MMESVVWLLFLGLILFLVGTGFWEGIRGQQKKPQTPREIFLTIVFENLGHDSKQFDDSTSLWVVMGDEVDPFEVLLDLEKELGIKLAAREIENMKTVGSLWELVERKIAARS